jgi:hypothetical protein
MAGRPSRVRRLAFLLALLVSTAVYAYSLAGIVGATGELRSAVSARSVERPAPVVHRQQGGERRGDCPDRADEPRVEL